MTETDVVKALWTVRHGIPMSSHACDRNNRLDSCNLDGDLSGDALPMFRPEEADLTSS